MEQQPIRSHGGNSAANQIGPPMGMGRGDMRSPQQVPIEGRQGIGPEINRIQTLFRSKCAEVVAQVRECLLKWDLGQMAVQ